MASCNGFINCYMNVVTNIFQNYTTPLQPLDVETFKQRNRINETNITSQTVKNGRVTKNCRNENKKRNPPPSLFEELLFECKPKTWSKKPLPKNKIFAYVHLNKTSEEYKAIEKEFLSSTICCNLKITRIERIEHPFAYLSFFIRCKEIKEKFDYDPKIERFFIPIHRNLFDHKIISYNVDLRRLKENEVKKCGFFVIVLKVMCDSNHNSFPIILEELKDNEKCPEYLIFLEEGVPESVHETKTKNVEFCEKRKNSVCFPRFTNEFYDLFHHFPNTRAQLLFQGSKYPFSLSINNFPEECQCIDCIFLNNDFQRPIPLVVTKNQLRFWNALLNY